MQPDADEIALAALLYSVYIEALGYKPSESNFKDEPARLQTAWKFVAQYVIANKNEGNPDERKRNDGRGS